MAYLKVIDGDGSAKYVQVSGAGTTGDPYIPAHEDVNSDDLLTAAVAIESAVELIDNMISGSRGLVTEDNSGAIKTAAEAIQTAVEVLDNIVSGSEAQVDVVSSALPTGASTAANQSTAIGYLSEIEGAVETIEGAVSGSEVQVDVVAAIPAGDNNIGNVDLASAIPAGTNAIGKVDVKATGTIARAAVNLSASGNLVAATADVKTKVLGLMLMADADLTVTIEDGSGGTDLIPAIPFAVDGNGFVLPMAMPGYHWIETSVNTALYATISGTGNLTGCIVYYQEA